MIGYDNWQFTPNGGTAVTSDHLGVRGANTLSFDPGQALTASTLLAFDVARSAGTLSLLNLDGSVLVTWLIP